MYCCLFLFHTLQKCEFDPFSGLLKFRKPWYHLNLNMVAKLLDFASYTEALTIFNLWLPNVLPTDKYKLYGMIGVMVSAMAVHLEAASIHGS